MKKFDRDYMEFRELVERHEASRRDKGVKPLTRAELFMEWSYPKRVKENRGRFDYWMVVACFRISKWARRKGMRILKGSDIAR